MEKMTLRQRATLVEALSSSLTHGGEALGTVPKALRRLLDHGAWRDFITNQGDPVHHDKFLDFVTAKPPRGLDATPELLYRVAPELTGQLDALFGSNQGKRTDLDGNFVNNINEVKRPEGTSVRASLRRLRKDRPDLYERVQLPKGDPQHVSANWAMVEAKFRPKTISVPVTRPEAVARSLLKNMSADDLAKLIAVLVGAAPLSGHQGDGTE